MSSESEPNLDQQFNPESELNEIPFGEAREIIKGWAQIKKYLPENINPHHKRFLRDYFRAQLAISRGKREKAKRIFKGLIQRTGYKEFEESNERILAAIDIAVKGKTQWDAIPAFKINSKLTSEIS